jgi:hypothetical protein
VIRSSITDCQCQTFKSFLSLDGRVPYSSAVARYVLHSFASLTQYLMRDLARPCVYINASVANAFGTINAASVGGLKGWHKTPDEIPNRGPNSPTTPKPDVS